VTLRLWEAKLRPLFQQLSVPRLNTHAKLAAIAKNAGQTIATRIADSPWIWRKLEAEQSSQSSHELTLLDHEYDDKGWCMHCGMPDGRIGGKGKCEARVVLS
jgi:hypothetical protein